MPLSSAMCALAFSQASSRTIPPASYAAARVSTCLSHISPFANMSARVSRGSTLSGSSRISGRIFGSLTVVPPIFIPFCFEAGNNGLAACAGAPSGFASSLSAAACASIPAGGGFGGTWLGITHDGGVAGGRGTPGPGPKPFGGGFGGPLGGNFTGGACNVLGGAAGGSFTTGPTDGDVVDGPFTSGADPSALLGLSEALLPYADVVLMHQPFSRLETSKNSTLSLTYSSSSSSYLFFSSLLPR